MITYVLGEKEEHLKEKDRTKITLKKGYELLAAFLTTKESGLVVTELRRFTNKAEFILNLKQLQEAVLGLNKNSAGLKDLISMESKKREFEWTVEQSLIEMMEKIYCNLIEFLNLDENYQNINKINNFDKDHYLQSNLTVNNNITNEIYLIFEQTKFLYALIATLVTILLTSFFYPFLFILYILLFSTFRHSCYYYYYY